MKKILIIEDDQNIRNNLTDLLEINNYSVFLAENGNSGIKLAEEILPDLIICDVMMPKLNGYEVREELSKILKTASIPFIYLSAKAGMDDLRKGMILGADDYIIKPFNNDDLLKSIEARLKRFGEISNQSIIAPKAVLKNTKEHLLLNSNRQTNYVKIKDIILIKAEGNYSRAFISNGTKLMVQKLLKNWEDILPEESFKRIHQSTIVNFDFLEKIEKLNSRSYIIRLKNIKDAQVISQRFAKKLKELLSF